jgi:branched-subunit amino acid transport protein
VAVLWLCWWVAVEAWVRSWVSVEFVVDQVTLGQVFTQVLQFSPVIIIPPLLRTHLFIDQELTALYCGTLCCVVQYRRT